MSISRTIRVWLCGLLVSGLFGAERTRGADLPQPRDVWYAYVAKEQRYGYDHVVVRRQDDGNFRYEIETRALIDFLGQREEITEKGTYVVTPQLEPVSVELECKRQAGTVRVHGKAEGRRLMVTWQRDPVRREATFELAPGTIFGVCLDDWLRGLSKETDTATCQTIDVNLLAQELIQVTRQKRPETEATVGAAWTVKADTMGQGEIILDGKGIRQEQRHRIPPVHLVRATADEARKIRHRDMTGREVLMFPVEGPIAAPAALTALTVRLRWKGVPWQEFALEDERQHVVRRSERDGEYEAVVRIESPKPLESTQGYPVKGEEFTKYLGETLYIKPNDVAIVRQAKEWAGKEPTALGAVRALSAAVFKHMQGGSLIAETLTGPEVLQSRQGKCSEYSVLFASLARSLGIPTRIVLGMRLLQGSWVGHMWTEAYVGHWITVDATTDEVGNAPTLLKLVHSDRVLGTQSVRFGVVESLQVTIDDSLPRLAAGGYKTGIEGPVYTNAELGCRLTAPHKDWTLVDARRGPLHPPTIRFKVPGQDAVLIHFVAISLPPAVTPTMLMELRLSRLKAMHKEFELLKNEPYRLPRTEGRTLVFHNLKEKPTPTRMKTTEILWQEKSGCFLLNLIADEASHDQYLADFHKLLASFELLPDAPQKSQPKQATSNPR